MGRALRIICGVVLAVGLLGAQLAPQSPDPDRSGQNTQPTSNPGSIAPEPENDRESGISDGAAQVEANELSRSDLAAQRWMALFAALQVILTGIGIWFIRRTLLATENAVTEAASATDAARDAVAETSRIGEAQVRAYVSVIGAKFSWIGDREYGLPNISTAISINNSGSTPAKSVVYHLGSKVISYHDLYRFTCPDPPHLSPMATIPGGITRTETLPVFDIANTLRNYEEKHDLVGMDTKVRDAPVLIMWGTVIYTDVFDKSFRSDFAFYINPYDGMTDQPLNVVEGIEICKPVERGVAED